MDVVVELDVELDVDAGFKLWPEMSYWFGRALGIGCAWVTWVTWVGATYIYLLFQLLDRGIHCYIQ